MHTAAHIRALRRLPVQQTANHDDKTDTDEASPTESNAKANSADTIPPSSVAVPSSNIALAKSKHSPKVQTVEPSNTPVSASKEKDNTTATASQAISLVHEEPFKPPGDATLSQPPSFDYSIQDTSIPLIDNAKVVGSASLANKLAEAPPGANPAAPDTVAKALPAASAATSDVGLAADDNHHELPSVDGDMDMEDEVEPCVDLNNLGEGQLWMKGLIECIREHCENEEWTEVLVDRYLRFEKAHNFVSVMFTDCVF